MLEDEFGYDVDSVAHKGDRVEDMVYSGDQLEEFARRLEKILRTGRVPRAILLSGGGNDIAGSEFALLLNHAVSSLPSINDDIVTGVIQRRLREAMVTTIRCRMDEGSSVGSGFCPVPGSSRGSAKRGTTI
jgi:hypothetical protein